MVLRTFNPKDVSVVVGGRVITGFGPDTFISADRENDSFTKQVGASGEVARANNNDMTGTITITLMQTSPDNDFLSGLVAADELNGSGITNVLVRDPNGTTLIESAESWIRKPATTEFSRENGTREWVIDCAELLMTIGGNA